MRQVLVAGGAGFLGSHLCETLVRRGDNVLCVDNFYTGSPKNVAHLVSSPRFRLIEHNILNGFAFSDPVHEIYNLACPASPIHYQKDPHYTVMVNVVGVLHLLAIARRNNAKLLQASTSEVYGDPPNNVQRETDWGNVNCTGPRACYDEGKRCAEAILFDEWRSSRMPVKVARIFNTYGPRMQEDDGRIVSNFIVQGLSGRPITVYGDGSQTRSFCYVDDLVEGLIKLMDSPPDVTGPINLVNPEQLSAMTLAKRISRLLGIKPVIVFRPLPADDPKRRRPDISRAKAVLGWAPRTGLNDGLVQTIAYFRSQRVAHERRIEPALPSLPSIPAGAISAVSLT